MINTNMALKIVIVILLVNGIFTSLSLDRRQLSGNANLKVGSAGNVGVSVQNGQVSANGNLNLPGGSNVNVGVQNGQVSAGGTLQLPGGSSVSANLQNSQVSGSGTVQLPGGSSVNANLQNGQVSGSANLQLPSGSSVNANLQNGQVSGSANLQLPGGSSVNANLQNGQISGSANLQLPGGSSVNANLQNGQVSGGANIALGNGGKASVNVQNGQVTGGLTLPGGSSGGGNTGGTGFNPLTFVAQAGVDQFKQMAQSLTGGSGGGSGFQPGNMGGTFNFKPGQMMGSSGTSGGGSSMNLGSGGFGSGSGSGSSGSGGFSMGSGSGGFNMGSGSGGFNMGSGGSSSGSGSGGFNMGSGSVGFSMGSGGSSSGSGGFSMGSGSGGFNMGSGGSSGGSGSGNSGSGGFSMGSGSSGFNMGSGGSSSGSGSGGFSMGSGSGGFSMGSGSGGFNMGSGGSSSGSGSGSSGSGSGGSSSSQGGSVGQSSSSGGNTGGSQGRTSSSRCSPSAGMSSQNPPSGSCLCLTGTDVIVRANGDINSNKLGAISRPKCVTYTGSKITPCLHDPNTNDRRSWFKITLGGQTGWIAGDYLQVADKSKCRASSSSTSGSGSGSGSGQTSSSRCSPSAGISSQNPQSGSCLCLTGTNVIVHANGDINSKGLGAISRPQCITYTGSKITPCLHDPNTNDRRAWFRITLGGQTGWIAGDYLQVADKSKCGTSAGSTNSGNSNGNSGGTSSSSGSGSHTQASKGTLSNCFPGSEMDALKQKIMEYEALKTTAYDAQPQSSYKDWTVCVGFNMRRSNARTVFKQALPSVDFDAVYNGQAMTRDQCMTLYTYDLDINYVSIPKSKFGASFCKLPLLVKIAMVSAYYRGDMGPKTEALIRNGDWCHVKAEYLNHGDYINCIPRHIPGVCKRMDWNAAQFQSMCHAGSTQISGSTSTQTSGSGVCDPVAKEYACKILQLHNAGRMTLWDQHSSGHPDNAYSLNNIKDTCNGKKASRSHYTCSECASAGAPGGSVCLSPQLMKYIYDLGSRGAVHVNEIAGACHGCGSWHYEGKAVDLQTSSRNQDYMDTCRRYGGSPLDEGHHIHCTIKT